jgi:hypothetical protein
VDDGRTLHHESKFVDPRRVGALTRLARERDEFVADLGRLADREQPHDRSWSELSREAERDVWVATAGRNSGDAIASCRVLAARRRRLQEEDDELNKLRF